MVVIILWTNHNIIYVDNYFYRLLCFGYIGDVYKSGVENIFQESYLNEKTTIAKTKTKKEQ